MARERFIATAAHPRDGKRWLDTSDLAPGETYCRRCGRICRMDSRSMRERGTCSYCPKR